MKKSYPVFSSFIASLGLLLILAGCGNGSTFLSKKKLGNSLEGSVWKRVSFWDSANTDHNNPDRVILESEWTFKGGVLDILNNYKNGAVLHGSATYTLSAKRFSPTITFTGMAFGTQKLVLWDGTWDIIELKKGVLRIAKDGGIDDNDPTTQTGGLIMIEFVKK